MKKASALALALAAILLGGRIPVQANALVPEMTKSAAPESLPAGAQVVSLDIQPAKVVLSGQYAAAQLVVTAKLATGDTVDVTRIAKLQLDGGVAEVTPLGQVKPLRNGTGALRIEIGGKTASAPVDVADIVEAQPVDFIRDVNPVMTKLGCNAGTCHGAKDGKVGFKLSLRGYDPIYDVRSLKDDLAARRLNAASPDDSLMLLKATAGVPHEGGQRTKLGEKYYNILRAWIADGAKLDLKAPRVTKIEVFPHDPVVQQIGARQQVRVVATYGDGKVRDVTAEAFLDSGNTDVAKTDGGGLVDTLRRGEAPLLARYEGNYAATTLTVMGDRTGFVWQQPETWGRIDELVAVKLQRMRIQQSELCTDADFIRRVYLDLTGLPPSAEETRAFVADTGPVREKRNAVIDRLIGSPEFVEHWTNKWSDMLQVNSKFLGADGAKLFREWIRKEVAANTPYDEFVRKIITASGSNKENPAASYWKILREPSEAMENTTHLFLATRFNCNKCHDHPFERWTQDQYYHLGAFFSQVQLAYDPASGKSVIGGSAVEKPRPLYEIVKDGTTGEMTHLRTNKVAEPTFPYPVKAEAEGSRRAQLAAWMTSPDNRFFASSYVNRLWGYLTGTGIIEPLDDIRAGNPPTNPELLEYLKTEFLNQNFDMRHVLRLICQSRTYQLSVGTNKWNEDDKINYSHAQARRLPAEVLYDAVIKVTGAPGKLPGGGRANQLPDSALDLPSGFLANLGRPARESACECERSSDLRLGSVMALLSGPAVADAIGDPKNALAELVAKESDDAKLVDEVFTRVLNRPATPNEIKKALASWGTIDSENTALLAELEAREKEQAPITAKMEADRITAIDASKTELTRFETEIAPKVATAEKKRQEEIAAAEVPVKDYEKTKLAAAQAKFEETVPAARTYTGWQPLDFTPENLRATNGVVLTQQPDGSIKAGPLAIPSSIDYTVMADTKIAGITGVLLEALTSGDEPGFGPGRSSGNFILGELVLKASEYKGAPVNEVELADAIADFSEEKQDIKTAIDGRKGDRNNGWGIGPQGGTPHYAAFAFKKPLGDDKGLRLRFEMNFPRNGGFSIARFRLWVTTSSKPLNQGLPLAVAEAIKKPAAERTKEDSAAVAAYWKESDPELRKLRLTLGKTQMPISIDPGVIERRQAMAKAELPIRLDPKLVQLRADSVQSKAQFLNQRLTAAQDLTWALINNAAFSLTANHTHTMLRIPGQPGRDLCDDHLGITRRDLLRIGGSAILGCTLGSLLSLKAKAAEAGVTKGGPGWGKAKSVIMVYLQGGPSHLDLWDPKENVPDKIRSPFTNLKTKIPGINFTEILPKLATINDKFTMIRSMSYTPNGLFNHTAAIYQIMTGYTTDKVSPSGQLEPPNAKDFPNFGSNIIRLQPPTEPMLPFVVLPRPLQESNVVGKGGGAGFLGKAYDPYTLFPDGDDLDMTKMNRIKVDDLNLRPDVFAQRLKRRASLRQSIEDTMPEIDKAVEQYHLDEYYGKALDLITSGKARDAFAIDREDEKMRQRYGMNTFGQSLLLARRLVEAGTRVVEVIWPKVANSDNHSWDMHVGLTNRLKNQAGPMFDSAFTALIEDLESRGLLEETLVVALGEFGRSPEKGLSTSGNVNSADGRDHWPYCYTACVAGAGVKRGYVHGESDATGSSPKSDPVHPTELLATIYHAFGIDPGTIVYNHLNQPRELVKAQAVPALFA